MYAVFSFYKCQVQLTLELIDIFDFYLKILIIHDVWFSVKMILFETL